MLPDYWTVLALITPFVVLCIVGAAVGAAVFLILRWCIRQVVREFTS